MVWRALLDRYELLRALPDGTGWRARDRVAGVDVVMERASDGVEAPDAEALEAMRLGLIALRHRDLAEVLDVLDAAEGARRAVVVVRRDIEGTALRSVVAHQPLQPGQVLALAIQVLEVLDELHQMGEAHGALRPEALLLRDDGQGWMLSGMAWPRLQRPDGQQQPWAGCSTPPWLAPEAVMGEGGQRSDLYALGQLLRFALSGVEPGRAAPPTPPDQLPMTIALFALIDRLASPFLTSRYADVGEALDDACRARDAASTAVRRAPLPPPILPAGTWVLEPVPVRVLALTAGAGLVAGALAALITAVLWAASAAVPPWVAGGWVGVVVAIVARHALNVQVECQPHDLVVRRGRGMRRTPLRLLRSAVVALGCVRVDFGDEGTVTLPAVYRFSRSELADLVNQAARRRPSPGQQRLRGAGFLTVREVLVPAILVSAGFLLLLAWLAERETQLDAVRQASGPLSTAGAIALERREERVDGPCPDRTWPVPLTGALVSGAGCRTATGAWVLVEGGESAQGEPGEGRPVVSVEAFFIDQTEVVGRNWQACTAADACTAPQDRGACLGYALDPDLAVGCVDRDQAAAYCAFVGARLCTNAEWERAALGDGTRAWPWGDAAVRCELAAVDLGPEADPGCRRDGASGLGSRLAGASPYGVLDLVGSQEEWVADWHAASPADPARMDVAAPASSAQLGDVRGGSWAEPPQATWLRVAASPTSTRAARGVRCCVDLSD
jgi:formylglycine-generating enzyme required for sulfatase activity